MARPLQPGSNPLLLLSCGVITVGSSLGDKNTGPHDVGLAAHKLDPTSFIRYPVLGTLLEQG